MIIAIDPSIRQVGLAVYDHGRVIAFGTISINANGVDWLSRASQSADSICKTAHGYIKDQDSTVLVIETPEHWSTSRGLDSEASESVQKTYWVVGAIIGRLWPFVAQIVAVRPNAWKGSAPKPIMVARAQPHVKHLSVDPHGYTHDAYEAVCLAIWYTKSKRSGLQVLKPSNDNIAITIAITEEDTNGTEEQQGHQNTEGEAEGPAL